MLIEAYVSTADEAVAAVRAGAGRIELCGVGDGGLTASGFLIEQTLRVCSVPVHAMVRPRDGGFVYSEAEFAAMRAAVLDAGRAGAAGVVFGMLRADSTLDIDRMRELIALARPMRVGCHRAFDATPDPDAALDALLALGVDVVLTSGHAATALEGVERLARHVRRAGTRLEVMPGGTVRASNVAEIVRRTGARAVHARGEDPRVIAGIADALRPPGALGHLRHEALDPA